MPTSPEGIEIVNELRRTLRVLIGATIVLGLVVIAVAGYTYRVSKTNQSALCDLRVNHENQLATSQQFLEDNPHGAPGISVDVIQQGIVNQKATIEALSNLNC